MKKAEFKKLRLFAKSIILFLLPIPIFIGFSFLTYPLKPHCNLNTGLYGCTPLCEATGYFADGRPSSYKEVPCFHGEASNFQIFINKNILFVLLVALIILTIWFFINKKSFKKILSWIAFGPFKIVKQNLKNPKIISKIFFFLLSLPLLAMWLFGYYYVGSVLTGYDFAAKTNEQSRNQSNEIHVITDKKSCNEQQSLANAKNCTALVVRDDGGHGTGFSIQNGYLVTNKHVIEGAKKLTTWYKGEEIDLKLWNYSPVFDLAILKLPVTIPTCSWFNSSNIDLAETLYTVGWPNTAYGESTITKGIFSRKNTFEDGLEFIQTDAPINPGNSGGPLINKCGVVGINTLKESWSNENIQRPLEGLGNALSSDSILRIIEKLIEEGNENTEIPKTESAAQSGNQPSTPKSNIDLNIVENYLQHIIGIKNSWTNVKGCPSDKIYQLNDLFDRQIEFSKTLIERVKSNNENVTNNDLIMWDAIVKMSYESANLTNELNRVCH